MSSFKNAKNIDIKEGHFVSVGRDAHLHFGASNQDLKILQQNVATGAFHDAAERGDPPKCHPHTRLAVLSVIQEWVRDSEVRRKFIIWLYGPAGSGKSAIAQTIAEIFAKEQLVASFFFSRTGIGRNDTSRFIASISYQLSTSIPKLRPHLAAAVEQDPLIFSRTILSQMEALIIKPLNAAAADLTQASDAHPRLVIIDGLDEARDATTQGALLQALAASIQQLRIPLIFVVASRPETIIRQTFNAEPLQSLMRGLALDEHYKPDDDIRTFLLTEFGNIKKLHPSGYTLPVEWPTQDNTDYLVRKASGQFIYASTVMMYIKYPQSNPIEQLEVILNIADPGEDTPFAQLDALYDLILSSVKNITRVLEILTLIFIQTGYDIVEYLSVDFIETLLEYKRGAVAVALTDMHALIRVQSNSDDDTNTLYIYHASLHDFLMDKSRSKDFFLDARVRHTDLARRFLRYITTRREEEDEEEHRFRAVLDGFIHHYRAVSNMEELATDLKTLSLTSLLSNITMETFYYTQWDAFFDHLRSECTETNIDLYQRLRNEFDDWIRNRYEQYPVSIQRCISAVYATVDHYTYAVVYLPDIFDILTHTLPPSDAACLRKLDQKLFLFQETSSMRFANHNAHSTLQNFFIDRSRAGIHFPDKSKFGNLAEQIVKVLCQRGESHLHIVVERRPYNDDPDSQEALKIEYGNLEFFPMILDAAPEDHKLAQLLWELTVKYVDDVDDSISEGRKTMAESALQYMKRCDIFVPEHVHQAGCLVCENFTPTFSTPPIEHEEDSTPYTICTPDELGASQSETPSALSPDIPPKTMPIQTDIVISSSFRPRTAAHNGAAKVPPSATHHLSNYVPKSSVSSGSRSIGSSSRPTSTAPSTSKSGSDRLSNTPSVTSRARHSSVTPSSPYLSPSRSASTVAQTSRPKGRHGQAANADVYPHHKSPTGKALQKPLWK